MNLWKKNPMFILPLFVLLKRNSSPTVGKQTVPSNLQTANYTKLEWSTQSFCIMWKTHACLIRLLYMDTPTPTTPMREEALSEKRHLHSKLAPPKTQIWDFRRTTGKRKKKKFLSQTETDRRHRQRQTESTLPIRSSKPCTSLGLAVTMTDSLSMFRISVFLCNILGCPAAAAAAVAILKPKLRKCFVCAPVWDVVKEMLAIWAFPPTVDYYLLLLLLPPLLPLTHFTRCYLRCTRLLGDDCFFLDYCIICGHDERERFRITIPRCRTYAKKSAKKRQEQRRRGSEVMNSWTAFNPSVSFWHSLVLPNRNKRDSLADLWSTLTMCSVDCASPLLYALWVWCLISWFFLVFPLSSSPSPFPWLGARA